MEARAPRAAKASILLRKGGAFRALAVRIDGLDARGRCLRGIAQLGQMIGHVSIGVIARTPAARLRCLQSGAQQAAQLACAVYLLQR